MQFTLTRFNASIQPLKKGQALDRDKIRQYEGEPHLALHIVPSPTFADISVVRGGETLISRRVPRLAPNVPDKCLRAEGIWLNKKVKLIMPVDSTSEDIQQFCFPEVAIARAAVDQLRPFYDITVKKAAMPAQQAIWQLPQQQQCVPTVVPSTQDAPSSQMPTQEAAPLPGIAHQEDDKLPESQVFIETQVSLNAGKYVPHPHQSTDTTLVSSLPSTDEGASNAPAAKKRKVADRENSPIPQTTPSKPKVVTDLIDFVTDDEPSSRSLQNDHPAMNPYEGMPWGNFHQLSHQPLPNYPDASIVLDRPNRYITAGVYGMSDLELRDAIDDIVTEVGFQQMCGRVAYMMDVRSHGSLEYLHDVGGVSIQQQPHEDEPW